MEILSIQTLTIVFPVEYDLAFIQRVYIHLLGLVSIL